MIREMFRLVALLALVAGCGRIGFTTGEIGPPSDGTSGDGSGADAEPQPLVQGCDVTHPGVLLCEGFEEPGVMWDYIVAEEGTVARTIDRGAQGAASLKARINTVDDFKAARWGKNGVLPSLTSGELHIREYIWLTSTSTVVDQLSIMVTGNFTDPFPSANVLLTPGSIAGVVEGENATEPFEFPRDRWVCVEMHLAIDNTQGSFVIDVDGTPVVTMLSLDTMV